MTDLVIKNCDEDFAEMIRNIHRSYTMRIKCGIQINLSGKLDDFSFVYLNVHPNNASKLIKLEMFPEKKEES